MRTQTIAFHKDILGETKKRNPLLYIVQRRYKDVVKKSTLEGVRAWKDWIPHYPEKWIINYTSVVLKRIRGAEETKAKATGAEITEAQLKILESSRILDIIEVAVNYKRKNPVTGQKENGQIQYVFQIIPEQEAAFKGGDYAMTAFLKANTNVPILNWALEENVSASITFRINELGEVVRPEIKETSNYDWVDKAIIELLLSMPNWKPSKDENGKTTSQEFTFSI